MSLLDLSVARWDQKTAATLLNPPVPCSPLFLRHLISLSLVNLITLISGDIASNFYAKRMYSMSMCVFSHSGQIGITCCCYLGASWTETKLFISLHTPLSVLCSLSAYLMIQFFVCSFPPASLWWWSIWLKWLILLSFVDWSVLLTIITCRETEVWSL